MAIDTSTDLELAARLRLSVTRLARRLRQETGQELTPSQGSALATIERHGPITPSELASIERVQRPTATRVLAGLLEAGLVTRERDAADGRIARVSLTREGAALLRRRRSRKNAYLARRFASLTPDELEILDRAAVVLERLIEDEERGR
jgi:DNA-binding MarR family transcriptional regulator